MSTDWRKPYDYPLPDPNVNMANYMLAYAVRTDLLNANPNFLPQPGMEMGPQYANPQAYLENMIGYAVSLTQNNFSVKYAPPNWNAVGAGFVAAYSCFDWLKHLPVRQGDDNAPSVYAAWLDPSLRVPGAVAPTPPDTGLHPETGQSAAPANTIL